MDSTISAIENLRQSWMEMSKEARLEQFNSVDRELGEDVFLTLPSEFQAELIKAMPHFKRRSWLRMLPLDNTADVIQLLPDSEREPCLDLLDPDTKREVRGLLTYAEDMAGGLMTPQFIRLKPDMEVEVAIRYLRAYSRGHEHTIYYTYVVDSQQRLLGVLSFRELLLAPGQSRLQEIMRRDFVWVPDNMDQEEVARVFGAHRLGAIPVLDSERRLRGVVTYDDIAKVAQEEATEDIQKIGGMEALDVPYWQTGIGTMLKKRAGWLTVLFLGEMFTATAMAHYEQEIERAVVLALFIPLIISSGGNSGSQASTLIIRAMALGEIKLKHWWRVFLREIGSGLALGLILGAIGMTRILLWPDKENIYGPHYGIVALTVGCSLIGVVMWGATAGSMLPFALRKLGLDPASASAPFVATLVDVTGIIIYFTVASLILGGTLL